MKVEDLIAELSLYPKDSGVRVMDRFGLESVGLVKDSVYMENKVVYVDADS